MLQIDLEGIADLVSSVIRHSNGTNWQSRIESNHESMANARQPTNKRVDERGGAVSWDTIN
jgi:hypothetical protein